MNKKIDCSNSFKKICEISQLERNDRQLSIFK